MKPLKSFLLILSVQCNKVVSDILGENESLMKYQCIGSYAHFAPNWQLESYSFRNIKKSGEIKKKKRKEGNMYRGNMFRLFKKLGS